MSAPTTRPTTETRTLQLPGVELTYDVREAAASRQPALLLIGSPMGAAGFATLAGFLTDRTIVTYDPRGVERSRRTDGSLASTPDLHADDLHALIEALGGGPVDVFASSGGAVNALALVARHPGDVRVLVAHEPPLAVVLPDREPVEAAIRDMRDTYQRQGFGHGMAKFIAFVSQVGEVAADYVDRPAPDPAVFGLPTQDDGSRDDVLFAQNLMTCTHYQPDLDALRSATTRIVIAAGEESTGTMAARAAEALAERLGTTTTAFPSHHGGFMGGEYGQAGQPEAFAVRLREVLAASG